MVTWPNMVIKLEFSASELSCFVSGLFTSYHSTRDRKYSSTAESEKTDKELKNTSTSEVISMFTVIIYFVRCPFQGHSMLTATSFPGLFPFPLAIWHEKALGTRLC